MKKPARLTLDPNSFIAKVGAGKTTSVYRKNQLLFSQGEPSDELFFIHAGQVKISVISDQGKEAVIGILAAGQFLGEGCLSGQLLRISTARAVEECSITTIKKSAMIKGLNSDPEFSELFMAYLLSRNSRIESDLIDQLFNSSEKRLARLLLLLANFGKDGGPDLIPVNMSQETLAEMIGTTRSRVSFFMNRFRKLGFITYNGNIHVHQSLLHAVLQDPPGIEDDSKRSPTKTKTKTKT